jgi:ribonuclease-3
MRHLAALLSEYDGDADYKTQLQELTQARFKIMPSYRTVTVSGPEHARRYHTVVEIEGKVMGSGEGPSRKNAEQLAAREALAHLESE